MRRLVRLFALDPDRRRLLLAALVQLGRAAITVRTTAFPEIAAQLGPMRAPQAALPGDAGQQELARQLRWAIAAVMRHTPLRPACLAQALAARQLSAARGLTWCLHLGADSRRDDGETHAWLEAAGIPVTGYPLPPGMIAVGCFTDAASAEAA